MKKEKGITLVALVVTIVVLFILAGITIAYVFGDNGIIKWAQDAKNQTAEGMQKEQDDLGNLANKLKEEIINPPMATTLEISSIRSRIAKDATRWLTATSTPAGSSQDFEWSSSDTSIATVDNKGIILAKKAGTTTVTVKTKDGSNLSKTCEVTIVENAPNVETLTDYQTSNRVAKDVNGNLITIPGDFKVLTTEGTKITDGIVIQDREKNEFVWVPVDSISIGAEEPADDVRLGDYTIDEDATITWDSTNKMWTGGTGKEKLVHAAYTTEKPDNYTESPVSIYAYQELSSCSGNTPAKNLGDFIKKTRENGGYYFARYEASKGADGKAKSQFDKAVWNNITQPDAAIEAREMYDSDFVESDLINNYAWTTAIVFIQKYSGDSQYSHRAMTEKSPKNTGELGDKACNIHDMAANYREWTTSHGTYEQNGVVLPCICGGTYYHKTDAAFGTSMAVYSGLPTTALVDTSFRTVLYLK